MGKAEAETTILNKYGFHARPSTSFSLLAKKFAAAITVEINGVQADGKSVMGLMAMGAGCGSVLQIRADGADAEQAVAALKTHVDDRFGGIE